jgi:hypothetical protein
MNKKFFAVICVLRVLVIPVCADDFFPDAVMGMGEAELREAYPDLRFERNDAYISMGNAVITRCYIDSGTGLYRIEATLRDDDREFMNSLVEALSLTLGTPLAGSEKAIWNTENGNTFDDPNTASMEVTLRGEWITVSRTFKNAATFNREYPLYAVSEAGPAGGIVFYDKGEYLDGWRYLECAPKETEQKAIWVASLSAAGFTKAELENIPRGGGDGKESTRILAALLARSGLSGCAVQLAEGFSYGGADDWYVPTFAECYEMLRVLRHDESAEISSNDYWTSSAEPTSPRDFFDYFVRYVSWDGRWFGSGITHEPNEIKSVRFVRRF